MNEPERREFLRATCSCVSETPRVRIPCKCRDLSMSIRRQQREREARLSYSGNVRNNRSCPSPQQRACNVRHSCGTSIAFGRIHSRTCTCDSLSCKPRETSVKRASERDAWIRSTVPSDVRLWDLRTGQCTRIRRRRPCSERMIRHRDTSYLNSDLKWAAQSISERRRRRQVYLENR